MKRLKIISALSLGVILLLGAMTNGTSALFTDTETGSVSICAWVDDVCSPCVDCSAGEMRVVSDTDTVVTEINNSPVSTQPAVLA